MVFLAGSPMLKDARQHFLQRCYLLVGLVMVHDFLLVSIVEPVLFTVLQFPDSLSIHLAVVHLSRHIGLTCYLDTQVATRACGVAEWNTLVGGGNKGAQSRRHGVLL